MAKTKRIRKAHSVGPPRHLAFGIEPELAEALWTYHKAMESNGTGGYFSDSVKDVLRAGIASIPTDTVSMSTRLRVFNMTRVAVMKRLNSVFSEILQEIRLEKDRVHDGD